jgi:hypothetical protein
MAETSTWSTIVTRPKPATTTPLVAIAVAAAS